jgi:hypothetical protein
LEKRTESKTETKLCSTKYFIDCVSFRVSGEGGILAGRPSVLRTGGAAFGQSEHPRSLPQAEVRFCRKKNLDLKIPAIGHWPVAFHHAHM